MRIITSPLHHLTLLGNILLAVLFGIFSFYVLFDPSRDHPLFTFIVGVISGTVLFVPRLFMFVTRRHNLLAGKSLGVIEIIVSSLIILNSLGGLGLYVQFQYYDMAVHIIGPWGIATITSIILAAVLRAHGAPFDARTITIKSIGITLLLSLLWELWEFTGDRVFGTYMLGQASEEWDTLYDIIADILAMIPFFYYNQRYLKYFL